METAARIVELRRYALRPGQRDTLIDLFDREFVETQEAEGMVILGQFRDVDDPDSFVWLRGFADMETRKRALESFYGGPVWKQHASAANATMIDSDNVLLLRPFAEFEVDVERRAARGTTPDPPGLLTVTIWQLTEAEATHVPALFERVLEPALRDAGVSVLGTFTTEHSENTFPALPVRENENVFIWMSMFEDEADHARHIRALERSPAWEDASRQLAGYHGGPGEVLRLRPTPRSALHA